MEWFEIRGDGGHYEIKRASGRAIKEWEELTQAAAWQRANNGTN